MVKITFRYKDTYSKGEWRTQTCVLSSVAECKRVYGLTTDPTIIDYEILKIEKVDD